LCPPMDTYRIPPKIDLTPRRHHGYAVLLFIMGTLLPPLGNHILASLLSEQFSHPHFSRRR